MKSVFLLIIFFIVTPIVTASQGLFSILDKTAYNGSLDIITDYQDPDITIQTHEHIQGWVDVTGFENTVMYNETYYVNGSEEPTPVIESWIRRKGISGKAVDSLKRTDTRIINSDGITTVEIDVLLRWHSTTTTHHSDGSTSKSTSSKPLENLTLSTSIQTPQAYPEIKDIPVKITIYNNSINPHVDIHTPVHPFVTKTTFTYKNETITRITLAGTAATGAVNLSECLYWQDSSVNWSSRHNTAILKYTNESEFDLTALQVMAHTPYGHRDTSNYSIETVELASTDDIAKTGILTPIALMILFWFGGKKCLSAWSDMI